MFISGSEARKKLQPCLRPPGNILRCCKTFTSADHCHQSHSMANLGFVKGLGSGPRGWGSAKHALFFVHSGQGMILAKELAFTAVEETGGIRISSGECTHECIRCVM